LRIDFLRGDYQGAGADQMVTRLARTL
jgi:hypothetical protein